MRVVTISSTYGAGGSVVGPAVADRLGLPFVDRAIPEAVAAEIGCTLESALVHDGRTETGLGRVLMATARMPNITLGGLESYVSPSDLMPEEEYVRKTEAYITSVATTTGGVILGRAGAFVLAEHPGALHVRLDGPADARVAQAARLHGRDLASARKRMQETDRARASYVQHFYRADPNEPRHYQLVIDATALPLDAVSDLIVGAARAMEAAPAS
jgi:cytidylate kinase